MARRPDLAQKLLDDLRQRKQQMGLAHTNSRQRADSIKSNYNENSGRSFQSSRGTTNKKFNNTNMIGTGSTRKPSSTVHQRKPMTEVASRDIIPVESARRSKHTVDLPMAMALAFSKTGTCINLELSGSGKSNAGFILQRGSVDLKERGGRHASDVQWLLTGQLPFLSNLQIGEIARGAQNLNRILRAFSDGLNFDRDSVEVGRKLLKGAKDLEESLRMLVSLQEASDHMIRPQRKQVKLLKGREDDESSDHEVEESIVLRKPRFSFEGFSRFFFKDVREDTKGVKKKQVASSSPGQSKLCHPSTSRNSSKNPMQFISHRRSASCGPGIKPDTTSSGIRIQDSYSGELQRNSNSKATKTYAVQENTSTTNRNTTKITQVTLQKNTEREKVRIPNVIAKLMGLEELPPPKVEPKKSDVHTDFRFKQGRSEELGKATPYEKSASLKGQQKELQENRSVALWAHNALVTSKRNANMRSQNMEANTIMVLRDSQKPDKQIMLKDQIKDIATKKEAMSTWGGQNLTERGKVEHMFDNDKKPPAKNDSKSSLHQLYEQVSHKDGKQELAGRKKDLLTKEQIHTNKDTVISNHQLELANGNESQKVYQRTRPYFAVDRAVVKKESNEEKKSNSAKEQKNNTILKNSTKSLHEISPRRLQSSKQTDLVDRKQDKEFLKKNQSIDKMTRNKSSAYIKVHKEPADVKFVEQRPSRTGDKNGKEILISSVQSAKSMTSEQIQVLQKVENKQIEANTRDDFRNTEEHAKTAKDEGHTLTQQTSILHDLGQRRIDVGVSKTGTTTENTHAESLEQCPWEEAESTSSAHDRIKPIGADLQIAREIETVFPQPMNDEEIVKAYVSHQHPINTLEDNPELQSCDSKDHPSEGPNDNVLRSDNDSLDQQNQMISEANIHEQLTEDEKHLMQILTSSLQFLNTIKALFKLHIPVSVIQASKPCQDNESKLLRDCGFEVMRRKGKREEFMIHPFMKLSSGILKLRTLEYLIRELNSEIKSFEFPSEIEHSEHNTAEGLHKLVERDIENRKPDVNCMWDFGWEGGVFAGQEMDDAVKDMEKRILNELITDIVIDMI